MASGSSLPQRLSDPVQHGVDGLGQIFQLLLGAVHGDAGIQMGVVDLAQLEGQLLELLRRGHAAQPVGRGGQLLNGAEHLADGARILK